MNRRALFVTVLVSLALVACHSSTSNRAATSTSSASTSVTPRSTATAAPTSASLPAQTGTPAAAASGTASVLPQVGPGTRLRYTDGLTVSVLSATEFTPSSDAVGSTAGDVAVLFAVRITNGTTTPYHAVVVSVTASAGPSDTQCNEIFQNGPPNLGDTFVGYISPGESQTAQFGFDVPTADLADIRVSVQPDPSYAQVTFAARVAHV
jgi:hypothetical protein